MRKLAIFTGAFVLAAASYVYLIRDVRLLWVAGVCVALSLLGRYLGLRRLSVAMLGAAVGLCYCFAYQQLVLDAAQQADGTKAMVTVRLSEMPSETEYGDKTLGKVELDGKKYEIVLYSDGKVLQSGAGVGDLVQCEAKIQMTANTPEGAGSLNRMSSGTVLQLYPVSELVIEQGSPTVPETITMWLEEKVERLYPADAAGLVCALLTGNRSGLDQQVTNELSVVGISHAVAVSGMHVSMLMALLAVFCGGNPRLLAVTGIPLSVLFAVVTGASPSVCRAAVMQIILLAAPLVRRERDPVTTLAAAALVLVLENPWTVASVSFQLSFAAVAGLFLFASLIQARLMQVRRKPGRLWRFMSAGVSATLGATALTLPLTVYYFGLISIVSPLTNLMSLWAVTGIFTLGLLSCCLGPLGQPLAWVATPLCRYVLGICRWLAAFPYAAAYPQNIPLMIWAAVAYLLALVLLLGKRKLPVSWVLSGLTVSFLCCIVGARWNFERSSWRLTALDVGQGQCLMVQMEDYTAVVDCGGSNSTQAGETLARTLHSAGVTRLDALILTHYDEDHCGGVRQLLNRVRVDQLFLPSPEDTQDVSEALGLTDQPVIYVETLTEIAVSGGKFTLYPPTSQETSNNSGICVLATAGEYDMLITGDLDQFAEMRLLSRWQLPEVELLVAGHHGAKDSTSQVLLDAVKPEVVIISVGENTYGHPDQDTLDRITAAGAEVLRTDLHGTITIVP